MHSDDYWSPSPEPYDHQHEWSGEETPTEAQSDDEGTTTTQTNLNPRTRAMVTLVAKATTMPSPTHRGRSAAGQLGMKHRKARSRHRGASHALTADIHLGQIDLAGHCGQNKQSHVADPTHQGGSLERWSFTLRACPAIAVCAAKTVIALPFLCDPALPMDYRCRADCMLILRGSVNWRCPRFAERAVLCKGSALTTGKLTRRSELTWLCYFSAS